MNFALFTGSPKQNMDSLGQKVIIPSMFIMASYIIRLAQIRETNDPDQSFAIGQLMAVKRSVFESVGGLREVGNKICEDLQFARLLKRSGFKTEFIGLERYISCNMYNSFTDAFFGRFFCYLSKFSETSSETFQSTNQFSIIQQVWQRTCSVL